MNEQLDTDKILKRAARKRIAEQDDEKRKKLDRLRIDLLSIANAIGARVNVSFSDDEFPEVRIAESGISMYDRGYGKRGKIVITRGDIEKGEVYAREVSHFLRDHALSSKNRFDLDAETREFFCRLGERIARDIVGGTRLDGLFNGRETEEWDSAEVRSRIAKRYGEIREGIITIDETRLKRQEMRARIAAGVAEAEEKLENYFDRYNREEINQDELVRGIGVVNHEIDLRIRALKAKYGADDVSELLGYRELLNHLKKQINPVDRSEYDVNKRRLDVLGLINRFRQEYEKSEKEREEADFEGETGSAGVRELIKKEALNREAKNYKTHRKPYVFADRVDLKEVYSNKGFYYMTGEEIKKRFFKREKGALERVVVDVFYVLTPFFVIYILFVMRLGMTGMVMGISAEKVVFGGFIGIAWFVFFVLFLYMKVRKREYNKF